VTGRAVTELELRELEDYWADSRPLFSRLERRRTRLKRALDCGHVIDGSEPYRYQVWKMPGTVGVEQRADCEFCSRVDERRQ
jgi:hypothetical protein